MTIRDRILPTATLLAASLLSACASSASRTALEDYSRSFTPAQTQTIASAVEVTAPRIEAAEPDTVRVSGASDAREVRVRMLDPAGWGSVERLSAKADPAAQPQIPDATLESALGRGLVANRAEIRAGRSTITMRLFDVEVPDASQRAEWVDVTLDFAGFTAATLAAVMTAGPAGGAATVQRLSGD